MAKKKMRTGKSATDKTKHIADDVLVETENENTMPNFVKSKKFRGLYNKQQSRAKKLGNVNHVGMSRSNQTKSKKIINKFRKLLKKSDIYAKNLLTKILYLIITLLDNFFIYYMPYYRLEQEK